MMAPVPRHILSISYDEALLRTRELLLRQHSNYLVTSALGFTDALTRCKTGNFDLFILGHSIPVTDKRELVNAFRKRSDAPILALARPGEDATDGADEHTDPTDINGLLQSVGNLLKKRTEG